MLRRKALEGRNGFRQARVTPQRHRFVPRTQELTPIQQIAYVPSVNTTCTRSPAHPSNHVNCDA